jgi:hypothetical protein
MGILNAAILISVKDLERGTVRLGNISCRFMGERFLIALNLPELVWTEGPFRGLIRLYGGADVQHILIPTDGSELS